jgi:hypothetical protein
LAHPIRLLRRLLRRLVRQTARKEWKVLRLSMVCNLLQAAAEGVTLGVVFPAMDLLSKPASQTIEWSSKAFLGSLPQLAGRSECHSAQPTFFM